MKKVASHFVVLSSGFGAGLIANAFIKPKSNAILPILGMGIAYGIALYLDMHYWNKAMDSATKPDL